MKARVIAALSVGAMVVGWCGLAQAAERAALGVTLDNSVTNEARITGIFPGSPASRAGLMPGDRIVSINDQEMRTWQDVVNMVGNVAPGSKIEMVVNRLGWQGRVGVTLGAAQAVFSVGQPTQIAPPAFAPVMPATTRFVEPLYTPADIDDQHGYGS